MTANQDAEHKKTMQNCTKEILETGRLRISVRTAGELRYSEGTTVAGRIGVKQRERCQRQRKKLIGNCTLRKVKITYIKWIDRIIELERLCGRLGAETEMC